MESLVKGPVMMSSLEIQAVIAELAKDPATGVKSKEHKHILRDIKEQLGLSEGGNHGPDLGDESFRVVKDYRGYISEILLNQEETEVLVTGYSTPIRRAVLKRLRDKITELEKRNLPSYQIEDPIERAKVWIEEKQQHILELKAKDELIYKLKNEKSDKEMLAEAYLENDTSKTVTTFAKEIYHLTKLGRNDIFEILRKRGHLLSNNLPSAVMTKTGKFVIKEIECNDGKLRPQAYITPKGEVWLLKGLINYVRTEATALCQIQIDLI
jgi:hypothetical protein